MDYKIETKEAFQVVGKSIRISSKEDDHSKQIAKFWMNYCHTEGFATLNAFAGDLGLLGVVMDFSEETLEFTYMIAIEDPEDLVAGEYEKLQIPKSTWAIFESAGPASEAMPMLWERIYSEWFPTSGYEQADTPALEVYPLGDITTPDYHCEAWVPLLKPSTV